jgi:hypothetical protein
MIFHRHQVVSWYFHFAGFRQIRAKAMARDGLLVEKHGKSAGHHVFFPLPGKTILGGSVVKS